MEKLKARHFQPDSAFTLKMRKSFIDIVITLDNYIE
jgi:hypothetical protein